MAAAQNHLIEMLPRKERARLLALCEPVILARSAVLYEPGTPMRHVYFPTESFLSLVLLTEGHLGLEIGMIGREGMLGAQLALGVSDTPLQAQVQGQGAAWRIEAPAFLAELARSPALQRLLHRYLHVLMMQLATSAVCLRFHLIGPRLARWLLMTQDRAHSERFRATHESLASLLGVRRVGITAAASALQRDGLIEYSRGDITVSARGGLESAACSCYAADQLAYGELKRRYRRSRGVAVAR